MIPALRRHGAARQADTAADPTTGTGPGGMLRRHWLVSALLLAGLALRLAVQLAYRPALFYIDTTRYLYHADGNDPVAYRVPLRTIAQLANLDAVAATQHLLGLAMAVTIYVLLVRRGGARWLAVLAVVPVLLDAYQVQAEQTLMPDVWFEALIVAGVAILLWRPATTATTVVAAGLVLGAAAPVRQVGEILILPGLCYVLVMAGGWRRAAGHAGLLCVAFAVPILVYSTAAYVSTGHFWLSHTGVTTTYGRMARAADCATLKLPAGERALCPTASQRALGIDGLEHSPRSPLRPYYYREPARASRLVSDFNHQVVTQQPLRVLSGLGTDAVKLFAVTRTTSPGDTPISRWQFQPTYPTFAPLASRSFIESAAHQFGGGAPAVWRPVAAFLRSYQLDGGYTPGPLLALAALLGVAGSLALFRGGLDSDRGWLALSCLLFLLTGVAVLIVSDLFEFSWRYQLPALITLPPAGAAGLAALFGPARRRLAEPA